MWGHPRRPEWVQRIRVPGPPLSGLRPAVRGRPQDGSDHPGRAGPGPPTPGRADGGSGHRPGHRPVPILGPEIRQPGSPGRDAAGPQTAPKKSSGVVIEADELGRFVGSKADVHWVWVALDRDTRRVLLGMVVGDRSRSVSPTPLGRPPGRGPGQRGDVHAHPGLVWGSRARRSARPGRKGDRTHGPRRAVLVYPPTAV